MYAQGSKCIKTCAAQLLRSENTPQIGTFSQASASATFTLTSQQTHFFCYRTWLVVPSVSPEDAHTASFHLIHSHQRAVNMTAAQPCVLIWTNEQKRNSCRVFCFVSFVCFLFWRGVRRGERVKVSPSYFYSILSNDITKVQLMARRALNVSKLAEKQENMQEINISKETTIKVGRINQPEDNVYFENPWEFMFLLLVSSFLD